MADKIAIALCVNDYPTLEEYQVALCYSSDNLESIEHYNKGKVFLKGFLDLGFSIDHLRDILKETDGDY